MYERFMVDTPPHIRALIECEVDTNVVLLLIERMKLLLAIL